MPLKLSLRRKGQASKRAIDERHRLDEISRKLRMQRTEQVNLQDKFDQATSETDKLQKEEQTLSERKETLSSRVTSLVQDLAKAKKELAEAQAERTRLQ
jgi:uncharacterized protein (DUF3084 family)